MSQASNQPEPLIVLWNQAAQGSQQPTDAPATRAEIRNDFQF